MNATTPSYFTLKELIVAILYSLELELAFRVEKVLELSVSSV